MPTIGTGSPLLYVEGVAEQTGSSGTKRTVKITAKFKVNGSTSASKFGYGLQWRARVNDSYGSWTQVKGSEWWYGNQALRTFTQTVTVDVGTSSSKSITVGIYTDTLLGNTSWDGQYTWTFTVGSTNVSPVISGTITTSPSGVIPENTEYLSITVPQATDANNNLSGYSIRCSVNGGGYNHLISQSSRVYQHYVKNANQGTTVRYQAVAYDKAGAYSTNSVYSGTVTINRFVGSTLQSSSSCNYSTTNLAFTYSGSSNLQTGVAITRTLTCSGITIHGLTSAIINASSTINIKVYHSGTVPSGGYIKRSDIITKVKGNKGVGTLTFTLTERNANGSTRTSSKTINVDLRTAPNAATSMAISENAALSTAYIKHAGTASSSYFVPDGSKKIRIGWTHGSGKIGDTVKYSVYVAYGAGGWNYLGQTSNNYYDHYMHKQTTSQSFKYLIRAISSFRDSDYVDVQTPAKTVHYYNSVSIVENSITRTSTGAAVTLTVKSSSSLTNISTTGTWALRATGSSSNMTTGTLGTSQSAQTITLTGLSDSQTYSLIITYNDNTGWTSENKTRTLSISANSPIFFVNQHGIGVGGVQASSSYSLRVKGKSYLEGGADIVQAIPSGANLNNYTSNGFYESGTDGNANTILNRPSISAGFSLKVTNVWRGGTNGGRVIQELVDRSQGTTYTRGRDESLAWTSWTASYTEKHKPTASDVGALPITGGQLISSGTHIANFTTGGNTLYKNLNVRNIDGGDIAIELTRGSLTSYKFLNSAGVLKFQRNNTDVATLSSEGFNVVAGGLRVSNTNVVASGTNGNGTYVRYYDGTQICYRSWTTTGLSITSQYGTTALYTGTFSWTFPAAFTNEPTVNCGHAKWGTSGSWGGVSSTTTTVASLRAYDFYSRASGTSSAISVMAIGRWK